MTTPRYAGLAARVFGAASGRDPLLASPEAAPTAEDRVRAIEAIATALRTKKKQQRRARFAIVAAAALAASFAIGAGLIVHRGSPAIASSVSPPSASPSAAPSPPADFGGDFGGTLERATAPLRVVVHPGGGGAILVGGVNAPPASPLLEGEPLALGSHVRARAGGRALLAFSTGTRLTLEDGGDVTLVDGGPTSVIALGHGGLRADVAKLREHERFLVRTDDAEIEVRGTSFHVQATETPCAGAATRVEVYEGVVVVRHGGVEARLGPGDSWPAGCVPQPTTAPAAPPVSARPTGRVGSAPAIASASSLAAQNDLFSGAVAAKQRGDASGAIERFDDFVARYPTSPLAESAAAQRMKLLHAIDSDRTDAAARAYLARWPEGFARAEAEGILAGAR